MNNFEFYAPTKVIFGKGVESRVGEEIKAWGGTCVLVHFGGGSVKRSGLLDRVEESLKAAGLPYFMLGGAVPNPHLALVKEGIELCRKEGVDFILAVGGGSAMDSAKAIALGVPYDGDVWDFWDRKVVPTTGLPHANIPTLAATGSEMSDSSVITNEDGWLKRGFSTPFNRPKFTLMNPELLYTLPPYQTACGITDIMMHTMERYFSYGGTNEMTDLIAEALLKNVIHYGTICMEDPENYEARAEIFWAGSLSHNQLTGLGKPGDWATHNIEHELGGKFDVAHGAGLAAVWGPWAYHVYKCDISRFVRYARNVWGITDEGTDEEIAVKGIEATRAYFRSLGMPITIAEMLGRRLTEEEIYDMADKATWFGRRTLGNFLVLDKEGIAEVYRKGNVELPQRQRRSPVI